MQWPERVAATPSSPDVGAVPSPRETLAAPFGVASGPGDEASLIRHATRASQPRFAMQNGGGFGWGHHTTFGWHGGLGLLTGSRAFLTGTETIPAGNTAFRAGNGAIPMGNEATPVGNGAIPTGNNRVSTAKPLKTTEKPQFSPKSAKFDVGDDVRSPISNSEFGVRESGERVERAM